MNLIVVILDSLRKDHVGAYGNEWIRTDNLDRFARDGVRFTRAYPESCPTLPFRTSLLTGRRVYPFRRWKPGIASYPYIEIYKTGRDLSIPGWAPLQKDDIPISELLHDQGYSTVLVTDCLHQMYPGMNFNRGYQAWNWVRGQEWDLCKLASLTVGNGKASDFFTDRTDMKHPKVWETERNLINTNRREYEEEFFAPQVFRQAERWLEELYEKGDDFFLCVDCFDPHEPWDPPAHYRSLYADPDYRGKETVMPIYTADWTEYFDEAELKYMQACYAAEVTMVDQWFGRFMDKVKLMGLDRNSLVVVVSDHGHQLGENGYLGKIDHGMLPCLMDLVLMVQHPEGVGAGTETDAIVSSHDILPTVLSIMGCDVPENVEGMDFWPVVEGKKEKIRDYATSIFKNYAWVRTDAYVLIRKTDGTDAKLYDIRNDPGHLHDIASEAPEKVEELWALALADAGGDFPQLKISFPLWDSKK